MTHVRVVNRTRGTVIAFRVGIAGTLWSRLRGFLGQAEPAAGEGILLVPCNAIHTFGMTFPLDVLFLNAGGVVLETIEGLRPWRRTRRVKKARYALEVRVGTIQASGTEAGDELTWMPPRSASFTDTGAWEPADASDELKAAPSRRSLT